MTTIKDIAAISGYSIGTVSRVINNQSNVSEKARQRILEVIKELNFEPNSNAKNLKQRDSSGILVIVKGNQNSFLASLLENVEYELKEHGREIIISFISERANEVLEAIKLISNVKPEGLIFLGGNINHMKKHFNQIKIPTVLLANTAEKLNYDNLSSYATDDLLAAEFAVNYLIQNGHKNIGIIGGGSTPVESEVGYNRYCGAKNAFIKNKIPFDIDLNFQPGYFNFLSGYEMAIRLLQKNPNVTAIFAMCDTIALGAVRALVDMKKRVPEDVSIIGFDGIDYGKFYTPRLTTIHQSVSEMAREGVKELLDRINDDTQKRVHRIVPFVLIKGESVKKISED